MAPLGVLALVGLALASSLGCDRPGSALAAEPAAASSAGAHEHHDHAAHEHDQHHEHSAHDEHAGDHSAGETVIAFSEEDQDQHDFAVVVAETRALQASLTTTGSLRARPGGEAQVVAPAAGRVAARRAGGVVGLGARVLAGDELVTLVPRSEGDLDLSATRRALERARAAKDYAARERARLEALLTTGSVPESRVTAARRDEAQARADLRAAESRRDRASRLRGGSGGEGAGDSASLSLRAPISGDVIDVVAVAGAWVTEGTILARVADLERLWLVANVPEAYVALARFADSAWFTVDGFTEPFETLSGVSDPEPVLGGRIDPRSRTLPLMFAVANPERALRIGMFARVHLAVGPVVEGVSVPETAILDDGSEPVVFVRLSPEAFARRVVRTGVRDRGFVQILSGVMAGEEVVSRGTWAVKLAASSSELPSHGHAH